MSNEGAHLYDWATLQILTNAQGIMFTGEFTAGACDQLRISMFWWDNDHHSMERESRTALQLQVITVELC